MDRSRPDELPRRQIEILQENIDYVIDDEGNIRALISTNLAYGKYLESGTSRGFALRPWLRPAIVHLKTKIHTDLEHLI